VALLMIVRPMVRRVLAPALPAHAPAGQFPRAISELESDVETPLDGGAAQQSPGNKKLPVLTKRLSALTTTEPEHAARLIRMWIAEDEK